MTWARPVPVIGDRTSAEQRAQAPSAWAFPAEERDALHRVIAARRDIRRFRPDPVPAPVLTRVLAAAHAAPSVGHSQPWRFIVVTDAANRERASVLADRERHAQAALLAPDSARRLLDLQLDGLREAPIGVVVCCDRRTPATGVLGRATFPDADLWSCACAIENLWLAARAEGLGLGWVTLFQPRDLAELLGLPDGVVTLGWLCLGWPDERPPGPGLERAGWSRRAPLDAVVFHGRWPESDAAPAAPPSHLRAPDQKAVVDVRDAADRLLTPPGSLGVLDRAVDRVLALAGSAATEGGCLLLVGADHPVRTHGVSAYESSVTAEVLAAAVAGSACGVVAAQTAGLGTMVVDAGVGSAPVPGAVPARPAGPRGDLVSGDALTVEDTEFLLARGRDLGREAAGSGMVALGEVGVANTTVAAALVAALLGLSARDTVGLGAGADSAILDRKTTVVEAALTRTRYEHGAALADPAVLVRALGGPEIAVLTGAVLGAVARGVPVVLDGLATSVAAALAVRFEPAVAAHLIAGQRSREAAHAAVLEHLGLEPLLDLRIRAGEGVGACLATRLLHDAIRVRSLTARTSGHAEVRP
ncbi:MAG TPA: 5,6-dimethylbenzimidazole synthase [Sporichthyaceae bacterium]|jgi:nicotinate-nucleotide--dimethylbenzimidazole phosphoribosyltransferase|nr:5,6-dimethylbenzimidazole synthase [Sporichthyaceae bacterium]